MQAPNVECIIIDHFKRDRNSPPDHFRDQYSDFAGGESPWH